LPGWRTKQGTEKKVDRKKSWEREYVTTVRKKGRMKGLTIEGN